MTDKGADLSEWSELRQRLNKLLVEDQIKILTIAGTKAAVRLDQAARMTLPPPTRTLKQPFKTARQRAWWWATMRAKALGKSRALPGWEAHYELVDGIKKLVISGAYKRTGKLVQSLAYRVTASGSSGKTHVLVEYGTNRIYARWVIDKKLQSHYHKGNWTTLQDIRNAALPEIKEDFKKSVLAQTEEIV
jgi:hypothetical protein